MAGIVEGGTRVAEERAEGEGEGRGGRSSLGSCTRRNASLSFLPKGPTTGKGQNPMHFSPRQQIHTATPNEPKCLPCYAQVSEETELAGGKAHTEGMSHACFERESLERDSRVARKAAMLGEMKKRNATAKKSATPTCCMLHAMLSCP